ncbi:class I SAM-dependent methyltransferase [Saccharothrix sp. MB29]|nr:class I SAM-dependent methyltransferase [Saccharothrix sp. MB29]
MSDQHASAELALGTTGIAKRGVAAESRAANRVWWTPTPTTTTPSTATWARRTSCGAPRGPRGGGQLPRRRARRRVLEVGCGSAPCARWLKRRGADAVAFDISAGMLRHAVAAAGGPARPCPGAGERRPAPVRGLVVRRGVPAFGAVPFVADVGEVFREVSRVLRPGAPWVFSVTHPIRWIFPDDPGPNGLTVTQSYFDRTPYVEVDGTGRATYVEHHRTTGDYVRALVGAGLELLDVVEPEWPAGHTRTWGQWSPLRGRLFPGTAIFRTRKS